MYKNLFTKECDLPGRRSVFGYFETMRVAWRQLSTYKDEVRSYEHG